MNIIKLQSEIDKRQGVHYEYDVDAKPLGEGAMGRVFQGYRIAERTGERMPVAIKAIYENIPERIVERARREAAIQLDNDNLIHMYGFVEAITPGNGNIPDKVHYHVIMELLVGVTLEDLINGITCNQDGMQIPFAAELYGQYTHHRNTAVIRIMKSILSGLMALHDKGFIHRDIDPSNIMVTIDRKIKLIDFGICKQIMSLESQDRALTTNGVFMGKVNYAAPELVLGDVKSQNYTTDIYAVGVLLYQLYTGHLPFSGTDQDVLTCNLRKPLPIKEIHHKDIKKIIRKATEKIQAKRYASVTEMRVDIEHLPVDERSTTVNKRTLLITLLSAAAVALLFGVIFWRNSRPVINPELPTSVPSVVVHPASEIFNDALLLMTFNNRDSISKGNELLHTLAKDSAYAPAMYEYGLTFAKGNNIFKTPLQRQETSGIQSDLKLSTQWLIMALHSDHTNYKAAYWIVENLFKLSLAENRDFTSEEEEELLNAYALFKEQTSLLTDEEAELYKKAMKVNETTLQAWGMIQ